MNFIRSKAAEWRWRPKMPRSLLAQLRGWNLPGLLRARLLRWPRLGRIRRSGLQAEFRQHSVDDKACKKAVHDGGLSGAPDRLRHGQEGQNADNEAERHAPYPAILTPWRGPAHCLPESR